MLQGAGLTLSLRAYGRNYVALMKQFRNASSLDFEGQYGGGTVMVWDLGTYELIEGNYYKGFLRFYLNGTKLKG